jgi:hypothetical protein
VAKSKQAAYEDKTIAVGRAIRGLMGSRTDVPQKLHVVYASPGVGGASILALPPQVRRDSVGSLILRTVAPGQTKPAGHGWPVTNVHLIEPHNLAILVTPLDVFVMSVDELLRQLQENDHGNA